MTARRKKPRCKACSKRLGARDSGYALYERDTGRRVGVWCAECREALEETLAALEGSYTLKVLDPSLKGSLPSATVPVGRFIFDRGGTGDSEPGEEVR